MRSYFFKTPWWLKQLYPSLVWDIEHGGKKDIYLTFDDGPIPEVTPWVLDILNSRDVKATFFVVGDNIRKHSQVFQNLIAAGHQVGNHTFNHLNGWKTETGVYMENFYSCQNLIDEYYTGPKLFRPPYGRIKGSQIKGILQSHKIIMWDYLTGDFDKSLSPEKLLSGVIRGAKPGSIIVFHDSQKSKELLIKTLPPFLDHFISNQYNFKTI